jgi:hypothetical protein
MALSGVDSIIASRTSGKTKRINWNKTVVTGATSAAGRWHEMLSGGGTGGAMVLTGTAGAGVACNAATPGALPIGPNVATDLRHLLSAMAITGGATLTPATILLTDIIHMYRSCALVTTPTALTAHPVWTGTGDTRMTNANGVECSLVVTTAGTAGNGALTPTYVNQAGVTARVSPQALQAPVATAPSGCLYGQTNTAVTVGGPYMPLVAGDSGVQQITSYAIGTGLTTGVGAFVLHRPICEIPLAAANVPNMLEWILGDRIYDDACLGMFIQIGGAATAGQQVTGSFGTVWG